MSEWVAVAITVLVACSLVIGLWLQDRKPRCQRCGARHANDHLGAS